MQKTIQPEILKDAVLFTFTQRKFGNQRKADKQAVCKSEMSGEQQKKLKIAKQLLESEELAAIVNFQQNLYNSLVFSELRTSGIAMPFLHDGWYLVRKEDVTRIEAKMEAAKEELAALVERFIAAYPAAKSKAQELLEPVGLFRESDYPSSERMRELFGLSWSFIEFGLPSLPDEIMKAEIERIKERCQEASAEVVSAMREGYATLVSKITDRLQNDSDGKPKTFRDTLFRDLTEFAETVASKALVKDSALEKLVKQGQKILETVRGESPKDKALAVRDSEEIRAQVKESFAKLAESVDSSLINAPIRKFSFTIKSND